MIWTPHVEVFHFESLTRDPEVSEPETLRIEDRWRSVVLSEDEYLPDFDSGLADIN